MENQSNPIADIANTLVALCREEKYQEVYDTYFTDQTRAVEAFSIDGKDPVTVGKDAIAQKAKDRDEKVETTHLKISDPSIVNGNQFIVQMDITTKNKET